MSPRWRGIAGLLATLGLGAFLGITMDRLGLIPSVEAPAPPVEAQHQVLVERLKSFADLSTDQLERIENIIDRRQATIDAAWGEIRPHLERAVDSMQVEIEAELRPEQREGFDAWWTDIHRGPRPEGGTERSHR